MYSVCFIGHRRIENADILRERIQEVVQSALSKGIFTFHFGDHSAFNELCHATVTALKSKYPQICRVWFRKDHPQIGKAVERYFLDGYEESLCPACVHNAGKSAYIQRNRAMIDASDICIFYCDPAPNKHSGTRSALTYAEKQQKIIINLFPSENSKSPND